MQGLHNRSAIIFGIDTHRQAKMAVPDIMTHYLSRTGKHRRRKRLPIAVRDCPCPLSLFGLAMHTKTNSHFYVHEQGERFLGRDFRISQPSDAFSLIFDGKTIVCVVKDKADLGCRTARNTDGKI
jgi:hypothetical protein